MERGGDGDYPKDAHKLSLVAGLFLPVFVLGIQVELKVRGFLEGDLLNHLGGALVIYVSIVLPILLGSIVHSAGTLLIPKGASPFTWRIVAIILAFLLPLTVILLNLAGRLVLLHYWGPALFATLVYGTISAMARRDLAVQQA
jgi:hypothetical protein